MYFLSLKISLSLSYIPATPAGASRQERSDRVSEEASVHRFQHFALTPTCRIFHLPHESFP
ncbi:hypothetical protein DN589_28360 [Klebsiella quasipneumoniae subsp. similipneumoniae]|uniref:Uncharacterized protein n=1 Tax=Salmonella enterica I TaxID=59201 RepID=A0A704TXS6_SALET|nr:hypothetical protein [Klebsiella pneumoniae]EBI8214222.1 hypothetical protein [Salmonella enterica]RWT47989.1 hypothetical protein DN589_28360 [Klebsiella quasipneumoniae subsp. similipneumoniae]HAC8335870.1 hypothetical protein [Salmonella enterica subsp. enterica]HBP5674813.1 hypothetical protein [Pseudomonas aeruginosa]HBP6339760.1 hypothetical protein [Pseudomonas aeruginosa]